MTATMDSGQGHAATVAAKHGFRVVFPVDLIDPDDQRALDWIEPHLAEVNRWDIGWLVGRYVHADRANRNGHIFPLDDLKAAYHLVKQTPLNYLHRAQQIIGHFIAAEMMWPKKKADDGDPPTPWVEALAAVYRHVFPNLYADIKDATEKGIAALSMEAYPARIGCAACGNEYPFDGVVSETYTCGHLVSRVAPKRLFEPHFVGGGLILPPARPGWRDANIKQVAMLFEQDPETFNALAASVDDAFGALAPDLWEQLMGAVVADSGLVVPPATTTATRMPAAAGTCPRCGSSMEDGTCTDCGYHAADVADVADDWEAVMEAVSTLERPETIPDLHASEDFTFQLPKDIRIPTAYEVARLADAAAPERVAVEAAMDVSTLAMIAFYPPTDVAEQLAAFGDEAVEELHCTILFLGDTQQAGYHVEDVVKATRRVAAQMGAFLARVSGIGTFDIGDGKHVTYASVDAPGLNELHTALRQSLEMYGIYASRDHGYSPHITLQYHEPGKGPTDMPPILEWAVGELHVVWAGQHFLVPLGAQSRPRERDLDE